jgi:4-amino-4-deoxy-L-arabinose transferase-like glycosyltransferase
MPLLTVIAYAVASGKGRRLFRIDLLGSLAIAVLPVAAWFGLLYARFGREALARIFGEQLIDRAVAGHDVRRAWWLYLVWAPVSVMPWLLLLPALRLPTRAPFGLARSRGEAPTVLFTLAFLVPVLPSSSIGCPEEHPYPRPLPGFAVLLALAAPVGARRQVSTGSICSPRRAVAPHLHPAAPAPASGGVGSLHAFRRPRR